MITDQDFIDAVDRFQRYKLSAQEAAASLNRIAAQPSEAAGVSTRLSDFDDKDHPFRRWWEEHGQFMLSGGGRKESIWAARGWIAREQLICGVEVTGESINERQPLTPNAGDVRRQVLEEAANQLFRDGWALKNIANDMVISGDGPSSKSVFERGNGMLEAAQTIRALAASTPAGPPNRYEPTIAGGPSWARDEIIEIDEEGKVHGDISGLKAAPAGKEGAAIIQVSTSCPRCELLFNVIVDSQAHAITATQRAEIGGKLEEWLEAYRCSIDTRTADIIKAFIVMNYLPAAAAKEAGGEGPDAKHPQYWHGYNAAIDEWELKDSRETELQEALAEHMPLEGAGGYEPGDAGCSCGEKLEEYTWVGWCKHVATALAPDKPQPPSEEKR